MINAPPPQGSPRVPRDAEGAPPEPDTGPHDAIATTGYVKAKQAEVTAKVDASLVDAVLAKGRSLVAVVIATVGVTASVLISMDARSQTKVDAGVAPLEVRVTKVEGRQDKSDAAQQQFALEQARHTVMLENLSQRFKTEIPPPAPKVLLPDGGSP